MNDDRNYEDDGLREAFQRLKREDASKELPTFEELIGENKKHRSNTWMMAVASIGLLLMTSIWFISSSREKTNSQSMQIIISYEVMEEEVEEELEIEGMDQWQSETDILLTGL